MNRTAIFCTTIATIGVLGVAAILTAGPLNPPAGPVAGTYKTLADVEPRTAINSINTPGDTDSVYKITIPGSYYLTGNVAGASGKKGIEILTSGVTIDLMGFRLQGAVGSLDGIATTGGIIGQLVVRNGTISAWGGTGVNLVASGNGTDCTIENIHAITNGNHGIVAPLRSIVRNCLARGNDGTGIVVVDNGLIHDCLATLNGSSGIETAGSSTIRGCSARENGSTGLSTGSACVVESCTLVLNGGHGIALGSGSTARGCTASSNTLSGVFGNSGSVIESCALRSNGHHGIQLGASCHAFRNECASNGQQIADGSGIYTSGSFSRIDSNHCTGNDHGIKITVPDNIVIRNTCSASTFSNWQVVAQNYILVINALNSPEPVNFNGGGLSFGTDNPNANFTFQ